MKLFPWQTNPNNMSTEEWFSLGIIPAVIAICIVIFMSIMDRKFDFRYIIIMFVGSIFVLMLGPVTWAASLIAIFIVMLASVASCFESIQKDRKKKEIELIIKQQEEEKLSDPNFNPLSHIYKK